MSVRAASRKRWMRFSARARAGSSERATAASRHEAESVAGSCAILRGYRFYRSENVILPGLDGRFDDHVHAGCAAVGHAGLAPHLDRERRVHERVAEPQEAGGVLG